MKFSIQDIGNKLVAISLIVCLVLPVSVQFIHAFCNHHNESHNVQDQIQFNDINLSCECDDFKFNHYVIFEFHNYELPEELETYLLENTYYYSLKHHKEPTPNLRGPPFLT